MGKELEREVVPTIDMQKSPFPYQKLREACEEWGCFRVVNHSVPRSVMSEMKTVSTSLINLPLEIKKRNVFPSPGKGYISIENYIYDSVGFSASCPGAIDTFCSQLDISSDQREKIETYTRAIRELLRDVTNKMVASLGVSVGERDDLFKDWFWNVRANKYSFTPETVGSLGLGSHTDHGFVTVLQDDEVVGGLEVEEKSSPGSYVPVETSPGNFMVIVGDMAVPWSNGRFTSVKHRVRCLDAAVRLSIGCFMEGPENFAVEAPEELLLLDGSHRLYASFHLEEYDAVRLSTKMFNGEALSFFRVQS